MKPALFFLLVLAGLFFAMSAAPDFDPADLGRAFLVVFILLACAGGYFLPSIIATQRGHLSSGSVFVLNFFLGWTFIGWVVALAMACSGNVKQSSSTIVQA